MRRLVYQFNHDLDDLHRWIKEEITQRNLAVKGIESRGNTLYFDVGFSDTMLAPLYLVGLGNIVPVDMGVCLYTSIPNMSLPYLLLYEYEPA